MQASRASAGQASPHPGREPDIPVSYGTVVVINDDGTAFAAGAVGSLGVGDGVIEEELLETGTDDAPPVGV